jgi:predicted PurR-regulated permease PerM
MSWQGLPPRRSLSAPQFALRCAIAAIVAALAVVLWRAADVVVLVFGAVVLAVALRSLMGLVTRYTPIGGSWALALVVVVLLLIIGGLGLLIGAHLAEQFDQLMSTVKSAWSQLQGVLEKTQAGRTFLSAESRTAAASSASHLAVAATTSVGVITDVLLILLVGLFLAAEPELYRRGVLRLAPLAARANITKLLDAFAVTLTRWLKGTLIAMLAVGSMTSLGLWLVGVPLALSLGILAGVAEFVPYLGPIVSSIPAILVAFTRGPTSAVEVMGLYLIIHAIEAYVLVPIIQKRAVALPPALGIVAVVFFGLMLGPVGVIFAHPLVVCVIVLVQQVCADPHAPVA